MCEGNMCKFQTRMFFCCCCCFQVLSERVVSEVRALVVLPTKELCQQVSLDHTSLYIRVKEDIFFSSSELGVQGVLLSSSFPPAGFQGVHHICWGNLAQSGDGGGSEVICCRTSFTLRTPVSSVQFSLLKITNSVKNMRVPKCNLGLLPHSNNCVVTNSI